MSFSSSQRYVPAALRIVMGVCVESQKSVCFPLPCENAERGNVNAMKPVMSAIPCILIVI